MSKRELLERFSNGCKLIGVGFFLGGLASQYTSEYGMWTIAPGIAIVFLGLFTEQRD